MSPVPTPLPTGLATAPASTSRWAPTLRDAADAGLALLATAAGLGIAIALLEGARAGSALPVLLAAVAVAVGDLLLRPPLRLVAYALGAVGALLAGLTAQVLLLWAALTVVPDVDVDGPGSVVAVLVVAAVVMAIGRWLVGVHDSAYVLGDVRHRARSRAGSRDDDGRRPGLLVVQLDGVSRPTLDAAIAAGLAPTMARWIEQGSHGLSTWWACVPSTTPASQAGLLHGNSHEVPAFRWWDKELGRLVVTNRPSDAALVEAALSDGRGLLAGGGVAVSTMFSGDADTSLLVMSAAGSGAGAGPGRAYLRFFASPFVLPRAVVLSLVEMVKELHQGRRQRIRDVLPRVPRRGAYVALRGITNVLLRDLNTSLVAEHLQRQAPVVFVDYVDYDEIAHHAGPLRPESLRALEGLDGVLALLEKVAAEAPRDYRIVVLSDHGQSLGQTFRQLHDRSLADVVRDLLAVPGATSVEASEGEQWGPLNTLLSSTFRRSAGGSPVVLGPDRDAAASSTSDLPEVAVIASGNLGLVWFPRLPGRVSYEQVQARWPHLLVALATCRGIGVVVVQSEELGPVAIGAAGTRELDTGQVSGEDPLAPYASRASADLARAARLAHAGDLLLVSSVTPSGQVHAFEELVGSHGGLGGEQNDALLLAPTDLAPDEDLLEQVDGVGMLVGADAVHAQLCRWRDELDVHAPHEPDAR